MRVFFGSARSGVTFRHAASKTSQKYLPESMGAGVAMLDYNNDGRLDLFFVNGAALADPAPSGFRPDKSDERYWNRLYRNNGDGTFTDVTRAAGLRGEGYGMGVAVGDYTPETAQVAWKEIVARLEAAGRKPVVDRVFPFEEVKGAFARLAEGPMGKVLVRVAG